MSALKSALLAIRPSLTMEKRTDGRTDGLTDGRTDGRTNGRAIIYIYCMLSLSHIIIIVISLFGLDFSICFRFMVHPLYGCEDISKVKRVTNTNRSKSNVSVMDAETSLSYDSQSFLSHNIIRNK